MALVDEVKYECGITWSDEDTDREVNGIMVRAKAILDKFAGEPCDYENSGSERQLFCSLCRYIYNDAFEEFGRNFQTDITQLRLDYERKRYAEAEENANAET